MDTEAEHEVTVIEPSIPVLVYHLSKEVAAALTVLCGGLAAFLSIKVNASMSQVSLVYGALIMVIIFYVCRQYIKYSGYKYFVTNIVRFGKNNDDSYIIWRSNKFKKRINFGTLSYFFSVRPILARDLYFENDGTVKERKRNAGEDNHFPDVMYIDPTDRKMSSIIGIRKKDWDYITGIVEGRRAG